MVMLGRGQTHFCPRCNTSSSLCWGWWPEPASGAEPLNAILCSLGMQSSKTTCSLTETLGAESIFCLWSQISGLQRRRKGSRGRRRRTEPAVMALSGAAGPGVAGHRTSAAGSEPDRWSWLKTSSPLSTKYPWILVMLLQPSLFVRGTAVSAARPRCQWFRAEMQLLSAEELHKTAFSPTWDSIGLCEPWSLSACPGDGGKNGLWGTEPLVSPSLQPGVCCGFFSMLIFLGQALELYLFLRSLPLMKWPNTIVWQ